MLIFLAVSLTSIFSFFFSKSYARQQNFIYKTEAGNAIRTRDILVGNEMLYH